MSIDVVEVSLRVLFTGLTTAILLHLTAGRRRHRIGVTVLVFWSGVGVMLDLLALKNGTPAVGSTVEYRVIGLAVAIWAMFDFARLTKAYATTTPLAAAEVARDLLVSQRLSGAVCAAWFDSIPVPAFAKAITKQGVVMLAINRAYEQRYGKLDREYAGSGDASQYEQAIAIEFGENDARVALTGKAQVFNESAPVPGNESRRADFFKFLMKGGSRSRVVCGIEAEHWGGDQA